MSKEEWKNTGKELGGAFSGLAKSLIRSVKDGADRADDWVENKTTPITDEKSTVFNDGTWRETGKDIGHAMASLGKTLAGTGAEAVEKAEEWAEKEKDEEQPPKED